MEEKWHHDFDPKAFLARVNVEQLLTKNDAYGENRIDKLGKPCILCGGSTAPGLLLSDGAYLCKKCFEEVSLIQYPEKYERLRRQHLVSCEARSLARDTLINRSAARKFEIIALLIVPLSLLLCFVHPSFLVIMAVAFVASRVLGKVHNQKVEQWDELYPLPKEPTLLHFHDPAAELSPRDKTILRIFNHWPGYPPFWGYLREVVLKRDNGRCQVTGCPSRLDLHIHHMTPISQGGAHVPNNLVSLCVFHHALEPEKGHERIWWNIKTLYFTFVCEHSRSNRATEGYHRVRPHPRRLQLITEAELHDLKQVFGFACPECGGTGLNFALYEEINKIEVGCARCDKYIQGPQQLAEETGPRLAEILTVTRNAGRWKARWDVLSDRTDSPWGTWKGSAVAKKRRDHRERVDIEKGKPVCPRCGSEMYLVRPRRGNHWKAFWGCTQFKMTGCRGSAKYQKGRRF